MVRVGVCWVKGVRSKERIEERREEKSEKRKGKKRHPQKEQPFMKKKVVNHRFLTVKGCANTNKVRDGGDCPDGPITPLSRLLDLFFFLGWQCSLGSVLYSAGSVERLRDDLRELQRGLTISWCPYQ